MPIPSSALENDPYLRLLVMGGPKVGKSTTVVVTAPGPVRVLLCEAQTALRGAKRGIPLGDGTFRRAKHDFDFDMVSSSKTMQKAVEVARDDAKEGKIKSLVVDTLSDYAYRLEQECLQATLTKSGEEDGRRAYPLYNRHIRHLCDQLFRMQCHVIVISHFLEVGGETMDGQTEKTGQGIVPLLAGKARALVAAMFNDVVWFDKRKDERVFVTGAEGCWGPGCRSLSGNKVLPADIGELIKAFDEDQKAPAKKPSTSQPMRPVPRAVAR